MVVVKLKHRRILGAALGEIQGRVVSYTKILMKQTEDFAVHSMTQLNIGIIDGPMVDILGVGVE